MMEIPELRTANHKNTLIGLSNGTNNTTRPPKSIGN